MNVIEQLLKIMEEKGVTRYKLEKELGIKQTTIKGWIEGREPGAYKLIEILKYLEISADELFQFNITKKTENKLTKEETELIEYYKRADNRGKRRILQTAELEAAERKESTYQITDTKNEAG